MLAVFVLAVGTIMAVVITDNLLIPTALLIATAIAFVVQILLARRRNR